LVTKDANKARLTALGRKTARPYSAKKLKDGARLMIIFDIPEARAPARQQLRWLLRKWQFKQIQKSVWSTNYDHRLSVEEAVKELRLAGCVELYEAARLYPKR
jgi:DNA-binding transcriptional regulator PaaX